MQAYKRWQCRACGYQFTVTAGTIFHRSKIKLPKWFVAVWLMGHSPKGVAAKQLEREHGVCYETAWYMAKRIRRAMKHDIFEDKLCGIVEVDATAVKADGGTGRVGTQNVLGMAERHGALRLYRETELSTVMGITFRVSRAPESAMTLAGQGSKVPVHPVDSLSRRH
jgi:hypothetical protein